MERLCQIVSTPLPQLPDDDAGNIRQQILRLKPSGLWQLSTAAESLPTEIVGISSTDSAIQLEHPAGRDG
jgi:hypothetical protein